MRQFFFKKWQFDKGNSFKAYNLSTNQNFKSSYHVPDVEPVLR